VRARRGLRGIQQYVRIADAPDVDAAVARAARGLRRDEHLLVVLVVRHLRVVMHDPTGAVRNLLPRIHDGRLLARIAWLIGSLQVVRRRVEAPADVGRAAHTLHLLILRAGAAGLERDALYLEHRLGGVLAGATE